MVADMMTTVIGEMAETLAEDLGMTFVKSEAAAVAAAFIREGTTFQHDSNKHGFSVLLWLFPFSFYVRFQ
jgi:hypothetical protein